MKDKKHVVIIGGGFAGINAAKGLAGDSGLKITLIDRRNHHLFQPLLYQVAMAALSPAEIAVPIRSIFSGYANVDVLMGNVTSVDFRKKSVHTDFSDINYDYLVLACGAVHSYFGHDEWESYAPGLKSLEEATEIRRRVLTAFEMAEREKDPEKQKQLLTFVVVGGGPTGVELAGALGEISRYTLTRDFRHIDPRRTRVILIEAGDRILPAFHQDLSDKTAEDLERMGVHIWTKTRVTEIDQDGVELEGERINGKTVLWAAGVGPSELNHKLGASTDGQGRVVVQDDLSIENFREVFVIGDQAHFSEKNGSVLPGLAPVAIQQGRHVAKNIKREISGKKRIPFKYVDKGIMATIGRAHAVVETGRIRLTGITAWFMWLFVHIFYLIGFRNRVVVIFHWAWSYFTLRRGARLITLRGWKPAKRQNSKTGGRTARAVAKKKSPGSGSGSSGKKGKSLAQKVARKK